MLIGLLHGHKHLGYLIALLPIIQLILVLAGGRKNAKLAKAITLICRVGYRMVGGLVALLGISLWYMMPSYGVSSGFIWISLLLWGVIEVTSKRLVSPQCAAVMSGEEADQKMLWGTIVQLVCLVAIVGLMTVRPF